MKKINKFSKILFKELTILNNEILEQLYNVHFLSLPYDIMHQFGIDLEKEYFKEIVYQNKGKIIIAQKKNEIVGYLILKLGEVNQFKLITLKSILIFLAKSLLTPSLLIRLIYQICNPIMKPLNHGEIDYFVVKKKYRSVGVGKKLISLTEKIANKNKIKNIFTKTYNKKLAQYYLKKRKGILTSKFKILNFEYFCIYWKIN